MLMTLSSSTARWIYNLAGPFGPQVDQFQEARFKRDYAVFINFPEFLFAVHITLVGC